MANDALDDALSSFTPAPDHPRAGVTRLRLTQFRNYESLDLGLNTRPVCLIGENGAGKTNLVEAVSFLGPGRGLRASGAQAVMRNSEDAYGVWGIYAEVETRDGAMRVATGADPDQPGRRRTRLEGEAATQSELARLLPMMWLTPREDRLWAGPRSDRMRFFDRMVLAADPAHAQAASAYEKAQKNRQKLLDVERETGRRADGDWLKILEREMAEFGVAMAAARLETLVHLQSEIDQRAKSAFPKADLSLDGMIEVQLSEGAKAGDVEDGFASELARVRPRDGAAGRALSGPHRTELSVRHREKNQAAAECSTGEQKALVLGLALAQARALRHVKGVIPILIFDEACAHLDQARRDGLAEAILDIGAQAWMTGVDEALFSGFGEGAQRFKVDEGCVSAL
ncbi:DNA replication/repair protein RecF [Woodsholea maritima]|uniref:DNA replication/repair protein RecF n=1 Tax=Woodsholea maritima TaxID=240237 RepID=UPI0003781448|nr:DNA replication/repair protein RecF [Woodsholea maritima]